MTELALSAHPHRRRRRGAARRGDPRPLPLARGRGRPRDARLDRASERAHGALSRGACRRGRRSAAGSASCSRSAPSASPTPAARPLLLPAARRPAEPAGAVRPRRRRRARTGWLSTPTRSTRPARPRSTGTIRATTAGCSPTDCPRTAASRASSTCSTSRPGTIAPDRIPHTRAADLAWLPDGSGFYYTRYPAPGAVPAGRGALPPGSLLSSPRRRSRRRPAGLPAGRKEYWPGVSLSPDGRWLLHRRRPDVRPDRSVPRRPARRRRCHRARLVPWRRTCPPRSTGELAHGRLFLRTNLDAPTYRLYEVDPERPARGALAGAGAAAAGRGARGRAGDRRPARAELSRAGRPPACAWPTWTAACAARWSCPTLGSLFGLGRRMGRPRAVLRLLLVYGPAERLPDRSRRPAGRRSGGGSRPTSIPTRFEVGRSSVPSRDGTPVTMFLVHRRGLAPHGRRARRISPGTAASTSA